MIQDRRKSLLTANNDPRHTSYTMSMERMEPDRHLLHNSGDFVSLPSSAKYDPIGNKWRSIISKEKKKRIQKRPYQRWRIRDEGAVKDSRRGAFNNNHGPSLRVRARVRSRNNSAIILKNFDLNSHNILRRRTAHERTIALSN